MSSTEIVQMATNIRYLFCVLLCLSGSLNAVLWSSKNCNPNGDDRTVVKGKVTDAICCGATHMTMAHSKCNNLEKNSCDAEDTCKWHDPGRNIKCRTAYNRLLPECLERPSCELNRDSRNNVCCKNPDLEKVDNCVNLMAGRCPSAWQVPRDCCPAPNDKYAHMLTTDHTRTDLVCCNAPCTAIEQAFPESLKLFISHIDPNHLKEREHLQLCLGQATGSHELIVLCVWFHQVNISCRSESSKY